MSFKITAAALAASALLVNAAPAPMPSKTTQEADKSSSYWNPYNLGSYGYGSYAPYGSYYNSYNPFYSSYYANPTPQAENYWGPNGFDGQAWNSDHRLDPYPGRRRAADNAQNANGPAMGPWGYDDGDDDSTTYVLLDPLSLIGSILPLPDLGALIGDIFGYQAGPPRPAVYGLPPFPKGAFPPKGIYPGYPKGPYPGYPQGAGMPRPRPGQAGGAPIVAPLTGSDGSTVGSVGLGLNGGSFSLSPVGAGAAPTPLLPGSPAGPFPKGWPSVGRPTPAAGAGGIVAPLAGNTPGSQSLGLNGGTFSLDGSSGGVVAPAPTPVVQSIPGAAGGIVSAGSGAVQSLGLAGSGFSLAGSAGSAAAAPTAAAVAPAVLSSGPAASPAGGVSLGLSGSNVEINSGTGAAPMTGSASLGLAGSGTTLGSGSAAPASGSASLGLAGSGTQLEGSMPMASPMAAASPVAAVSPVASPAAPIVASSAAAAAASVASPATGVLSNTAGGSTANGDLGLGSSSATIA